MIATPFGHMAPDHATPYAFSVGVTAVKVLAKKGPYRLRFSIFSDKTNTTDLYLGLGYEPTAIKKLVTIVPGQLWVDPFEWQGDVYLIGSGAGPATGNVNELF